MTAGGLNRLVLECDLLRTQKNTIPSPTTLYHYRNTLIHLRLLNRVGKTLSLNREDPDVLELLKQSELENRGISLSDEARKHFLSLVLRNTNCRSLFFDLFMPNETNLYSVRDFADIGSSVSWYRYKNQHTTTVCFRNKKTGRTVHYSSHSSISAVLYGLRYWARDELSIIDEYSPKGARGNIMFPLSCSLPNVLKSPHVVAQMLFAILRLRSNEDWTVFSVSDLINRCCVERQQPISVLYRAIDWLVKEWPHHTVLIPTSEGLATIGATSTQGQKLELKRYYRMKNSPFISHIRIHKDVKSNLRK